MSPDRDNFNIIKRDLVDSINDLKKSMEVHTEVSLIKEKTYSDLIGTLTRNIDLHHKVLYGDGTKQDGGLVGDVRDLKSSYDKRQTYIGWAWTAGITTFFTAAGDIIFNFFKKGH